MMKLPDEEMLTVTDVAIYLRISKMTVYRLIAAGELDSLRVGRTFRIRADDFDTYLARISS
jgi:excisionase family DNA binding protein